MLSLSGWLAPSAEVKSGAILKVSPNRDRDMSIHRLFTFNTQQRVRASLEDPEGAARRAHLLCFIARKGSHPVRRDTTQQLHPSGHAEYARGCSETPLLRSAQYARVDLDCQRDPGATLLRYGGAIVTGMAAFFSECCTNVPPDETGMAGPHGAHPIS